LATATARLLVDPLAIQHDQAFYVECGWRLVHGGVPYLDFFDINPPLIMYLNAAPAAVALAIGVNPIPVFVVALTILSGWSAWAALRVTRSVARGDVLTDLCLLMAPLGACAPLRGPIDVGQREHLFLLLYFPYFLIRVLRARGTLPVSPPAAFGYGIAAAAGACLKPYFAIPILLVEIDSLARCRARTLIAPEVLGALAFVTLYAGSLLLLPSPALEVFLHRIVPMVEHGYGDLNPVTRPLLWHAIQWSLVAAALAAVARQTESWTRALAVPVALFTIGGFAIGVLQQKGWSYHYVPARAGVWLLGSLALVASIEWASRWLPAARHARPAAAVAMFCTLLAWPLLHQRMISGAYGFAPMLSKYSQPGDAVVIMSESVGYGHPAVLQTERRFGSRHLSALLYGLARRSEANGYAEGGIEQRRFIGEVAEDIEHVQPAAVFLDDQEPCAACPAPYRLSTAFLADARLRAALSAYLPRGTDSGFVVFTHPR